MSYPNGATLRVFNLNYRVGMASRAMMDDRLGLVNFTEAQILYVEGITEEQTKDTILHEMLHCIFYALLPDDPERKFVEEDLVVGLTTGLMTVAGQNKELFDWIFSPCN